MSNAQVPSLRHQPPTAVASRPDAADATRNRRTVWPAPAHVFGLLFALRVANALTIKTFFQPDEYFQSLEPAWQLAFGADSGAWITWEWRTQLRSSLHPLIFAAVYKATDLTAETLSLNASSRAELLLAAPKVCQAFFAALTDHATWKLAEVIHGRDSASALATLALTAASPWQWFCSTRTLSNSVETTLTVVALCFWPWNQARAGQAGQTKDTSEPGPTSRGEHAAIDARSTASSALQRLGSHTPAVWPSLLLASTACILRPTNALIWLVVATHALLDARSWLHRGKLIRDALISGCFITAVAALSDRFYYGQWTLPPLKFLYYNIAQDLAVFYGRNRADYYLTEGLPLLLTTALPFAVSGIYGTFRARPLSTTTKASVRGGAQPSDNGGTALSLLVWTTLVVTTSMSLIAHKEVRFLYPLLPLLHVLCGEPLARFFCVSGKLRRKTLLAALLTLNAGIAVYTSQYHQRGVVDVTHELRRAALDRAQHNVTAAFLMPCHSTPWRSHLVAPNLSAWALTCEPPLDVPLSERSRYVDEADQFYADPAGWLDSNMVDRSVPKQQQQQPGDAHSRRDWPDFLIFFEQLEPAMSSYVSNGRHGQGYREFWRGFNSHWHDDWRRQGDVVVWKRTTMV